MHTLSIDTLSLVYRLPAGRASEQQRLERVVRRALDGPVQAALERAGISPSEELCIRALDNAVVLPPHGTDETLWTRWSLAFADAVRAAVERGGAGVVRYGSLNGALLDLACAVAVGDTSRSWAWTQLGLWPQRALSAPPPQVAAGYATAALARHATAAPAVLSHLASRGRLGAFWSRLSQGDLRQLLVAVLRAFDVPNAQAAALLEAAPGSSDAVPSWAAAEALGRGFASTALARDAADAHTALLRAGADLRLGALSRRALVVLTLLEADPQAIRGARALDAVRALEGRLFPRDALAEGSARPEEVTGAQVRQPTGKRRPPDGPNTAGAPDAPSGARPTEVPGQGDSAGEADAKPPAEGVEDSLGLRVRAHTGFGGLLFLLHVLDELRLPDAAAEDPALWTRPLRWTLHQLARRLAGVEAQDPAALVFCGLPPGAVPPSRGEPAPTDAEDAALGGLAERVVARARERLRGDLEALGDAALMDTLCRRRAEVLSDPGWLELVFSLDDVSTELRRAGLDLDPGWLPWLGAVVRFRYA